MYITEKQSNVMVIVLAGNKNDDGVVISWCDIYQIKDRVPHKVTREAINDTLLALKRKGFVDIKPRAETRNGTRRNIYLPTNAAFDLLDLTPKPEPEADFEIRESLEFTGLE